MRTFYLLALLLVVTGEAYATSVVNGDVYCSSASDEGKTTYDTASEDFVFCRDYTVGWETIGDIAPAAGGGSSGGSVPSYAGYTAVTLSGPEGVSGMDALCDAAHSGSRMLRASDFKYVAKEMQDATDKPQYGAMLHCDAATDYECQTILGDINGGESGASNNCHGWTSIASNRYVTSYDAGQLAPYRLRTEACNSAYYAKKLHCVSD